MPMKRKRYTATGIRGKKPRVHKTALPTARTVKRQRARNLYLEACIMNTSHSWTYKDWKARDAAN